MEKFPAILNSFQINDQHNVQVLGLFPVSRWSKYMKKTCSTFRHRKFFVILCYTSYDSKRYSDSGEYICRTWFICIKLMIHYFIVLAVFVTRLAASRSFLYARLLHLLSSRSASGVNIYEVLMSRVGILSPAERKDRTPRT